MRIITRLCRVKLTAEWVAFMAAAWHGGVEGADEFVDNSSLQDAISRGMDFWFGNDFADHSCLVGQCKCNVVGLWNTNWFSNVRRYCARCHSCLEE